MDQLVGDADTGNEFWENQLGGADNQRDGVGTGGNDNHIGDDWVSAEPGMGVMADSAIVAVGGNGGRLGKPVGWSGGSEI